MATVTIKAIGAQNILNNKKYEFIIEHLNKPLKLQDLSWFRDGTLCSLTIWYDKSDIIVLFPDTNKLEYEVHL